MSVLVPVSCGSPDYRPSAVRVWGGGGEGEGEGGGGSGREGIRRKEKATRIRQVLPDRTRRTTDHNPERGGGKTADRDWLSIDGWTGPWHGGTRDLVRQPAVRGVITRAHSAALWVVGYRPGGCLPHWGTFTPSLAGPLFHLTPSPSVVVVVVAAACGCGYDQPIFLESLCCRTVVPVHTAIVAPLTTTGRAKRKGCRFCLCVCSKLGWSTPFLRSSKPGIRLRPASHPASQPARSYFQSDKLSLAPPICTMCPPATGSPPSTALCWLVDRWVLVLATSHRCVRRIAPWG